MNQSSSNLPHRILNQSLSGPDGSSAVMVEEIEVQSGQIVEITFNETNSGWRQGVFIGTEGILETAGVRSSSFLLWVDSSPEVVTVEVVQTSGRVVFYNIWDSGRGLGAFESQSATSGMLCMTLPGGGIRCLCNDIGFNPAFDKLCFTIKLKN